MTSTREARASLEQAGNVRGEFGHLLEVVEQQEDGSGTQNIGDGLQQRSFTERLQSKRRGDRRQRQTGLGHRRQIDEHGFFRSLFGQRTRHCDGQPGFAHSPRTDKRDQPRIVATEQVGDLFDSRRATDETSRRNGQGMDP